MLQYSNMEIMEKSSIDKPELQPMTIVEVDGFMAGEQFEFIPLSVINKDIAGSLGGLTVYDVLTQLPIEDELKDVLYEAYEQKARSWTDLIDDLAATGEDSIDEDEAGLHAIDYDENRFVWPIIIKDQDGAKYHLITDVSTRTEVDGEEDDGALFDRTEVAILSDEEYREIAGINNENEWNKWEYSSTMQPLFEKHSRLVPENVDLKVEDGGKADISAWTNDASTVNFTTRLVMMDQPYVVHFHETYFVSPEDTDSAIGHNLIVSILNDDGEEVQHVGFDIVGGEMVDSNLYTDKEIENKIPQDKLDELIVQLIKKSNDKDQVEKFLLQFEDQEKEL